MAENLIRKIEEKQKIVEKPSFKVGDTVKVHFKIIEGKTERIQIYEGLVLCFKNAGIGRTFTVRKNSYGVGVERVFPLHSPRIAKVEVVHAGKVRRAKLYYIREKIGKAAKIKTLLQKKELADMHSAAERPALLIPLHRNEALNAAVLFQGDKAAGFTENEPVTVRILSFLKNNMVRIAVKGSVLQAQTKALSQDIREGAFLLMRIHIAENTVVLTPYQKHVPQPLPHGDVFTQLGIPQSDLAAALIAFFHQTEQPLQSRPLLKILSSLSTFAPHEKQAAFAATLLYSRGIEPSPQLIAQCLTALFTLSDTQHEKPIDAPEDDDLFRFLNHVKAGRNHWVVFPFEKQLDTLWKGSAAFLLDLQDTVCHECCLRVRSEEKQESWTFMLKNNTCLFSYQGATALSVQKKENLTALLQDCLKSAGVVSYTVHYADNNIEDNHTLASIDISV